MRAFSTFIAFWALFATVIGLNGCKQKIAGGRADGPLIYMQLCARCHGILGKPRPGMVAGGVKDLSSPKIQAALSDEAIRDQVANGSKNRVMPGFSSVLNPEQIQAVAKFVRSLRKE